jgi:hypothetical protein
MESSAMKRSALVVVFGTVAMLASTHARAQDGQPTIEGVWQVTRHGVNCQTGQPVSTFPALMTFHRDGTLHGDAVAPGSTAAGGTAEHGLWQREPGPHNYSFKDISYGWDTTGVFAGSTTVSGSLALTDSDTFVYSSTIQVFDNNGNLVAAHCGKATGVRFQ